MNTRIIVSISFIVACAFAACKKKGSEQPATSNHAPDSIKASSIVPKSVYPYTDTFVGNLWVRYDCDEPLPGYDSTTTNYQFYVKHINTDSLFFMAQDRIYFGICGGWRWISAGYLTDTSGIYKYRSVYLRLVADSLKVYWDGNGSSLKNTGGADLAYTIGKFYGRVVSSGKVR